MTRRHRRRFAAQSIIRDAIISMPDCALTTTAAVSTASSAPIDCPMKSGKPGVSTRWMRVSPRIEVQDRRPQRVLPRLLQRIEIADGRAALDGAGLLDRAGREQQRLRERGLARRLPARRARPCGCCWWRSSPCVVPPPCVAFGKLYRPAATSARQRCRSARAEPARGRACGLVQYAPRRGSCAGG